MKSVLCMSPWFPNCLGLFTLLMDIQIEKLLVSMYSMLVTNYKNPFQNPLQRTY